MRWLLSGLVYLGWWVASAEETQYRLYAAEDFPTETLRVRMEPLRQLDPQASYQLVPLPARAQMLQQAHRVAKAIEDGVTQLPCLALVDEQGCYACVGLGDKLTPEALEQGRALAADEKRRERAQQRLLQAHRYLLFAELALIRPMQMQDLEERVARCRKLMKSPHATVAVRQSLGLSALYPMLMKQYSLLYTGGHSPQSEAKLLEAIEALDRARDAGPNTALGRKAHAERERLRAARLQARRLEFGS